MKPLLRLLLLLAGGALRLAAWLVAVLAVAAVGALAALQTDAGRTGADRLVSFLASGDERRLHLTGLEVSWGLDLRVARLELGDAKGVYLTLSGFSLDWHPSALLAGRIEIARAHLDQLYLARLPEPSTQPSEGGGLPFLAELVVAQAEIPEIVLGESIAGIPVRLAATANARVSRAPEHVEAMVDITRRDGPEGALHARLRFAPATATLALDIAAREPRGGLAARLLEIDGLPALDFTLKGDGPADDWAAELSLALDGQTEVSGTARMFADPSRQEGARRLDIALSGEMSDLAPPIAQALVMGQTRLEASAGLSPDFRPRDITARLATQTLAVDASARLDAEAIEAAATVRLSAGGDALIAVDLPDRRVTLGPISGRFAARGPLTAVAWSLDLSADSLATTEGRIDALTASFSGPSVDLDNLAASAIPLAVEARAGAVTPTAAAATALAGPLRLAGTARIDTGAPGAQIEALTVDLAKASARIAGAVDASRLDLAAEITVPDLAGLDPRIGGALAVQISATGDTEAPDLAAQARSARVTLAGKPVTDLAVDLDATTRPDALSADLRVSATVDGAGLAGRIDLVPEGRGLVGRSLEITLGRNRVAGDLRIADLADPAGTLTGQVTLEAPELAQASALTLAELSGRLSGRASIAPGPDGPSASLTLSGDALALSGARVERIEVEARADRLLGTPAVTARANLAGLLIGGQSVARVVAEADTDGADTRFDVTARLADGARGDDGLAVAGVASADDGGLRVTLSRLDGRYRGIATALAEPARLTIASGRTRIDSLRLGLGDGQIALSGEAGATLALEARITRLPLSLADALMPGTGLAGRADGRITVAGSPAAPQVGWTMDLADVSARVTRDNGVARLAISSQGTFAGNRISQTTQASGADGLRVVARGPVTLGGPGALEIDLDGTLPLAALRERLILSGLSGTGAFSLSGRVSGPLAAPRHDLVLRPQGVTLTQLSSGLSLRDVSGSARVTPAGLALDGLRATVGSGGTLAVGGRLGFEAGLPADIRLTLAQARYTDGRIVQATLDADLALTGPLASATTGARLSGSVSIARADITIPSSLPAAIDPLSVTHLDAPAAVRRQDDALHAASGGGGGSGAATRPIALDVTVSAPGQIFVRGRGLDAELGGGLRLAGTTAAPQAVGAFTMRRGVLTVLTRRVVFSRGEVSFAGSLDPQLDFLASSQTRTATVTIRISGPARQPLVTFTSNPELPQDEVLAQFLFDRSMNQLSPAQIAQLGSSVLALTGGSTQGPLGALRQSLGLDAIDIDTSSQSNPSLSVGKYINDRIYLGVSQGTATNSSRVTVDIDVTNSLKLRGEVGANGESKAGVFFEREFGR